MEGSVDVSNTPSDATRRRADVLVKFGEYHKQFGNGIAIEIQHQNNQKDLHSVSYDYLANEYSVFWADRYDFKDGGFDAFAMISKSDASRTFFRQGAIELPDFGEFCEWDFSILSELLDGTQRRLPSYHGQKYVS